MRAIFTFAIFLGSFLLFLVQPMAGKMVLPTFGGAPAVWNASLVFFQFTLLLGYLYAHLTTRYLGRRQAWLHLPVMLVAMLALPFSMQSGGFLAIQQMATGEHANPGLLVMGALGVLVGLPFFIVSAGAPLLQRWFATTNDKAAHDPYFMYAASNFGSMLGLFSYPFFFESRFRLMEQSSLWQYGYELLIVIVAVCAAIMLRSPAPAPAAADTPREAERPVTWQNRGLWIALAAVPSSLLLGVTGYVTTNIAPVPLLWVIPLAIYLLTFILAFRSRAILSVEILSRAIPLVLIPLAVVILLDVSDPWLASLHIGVFFLAAWMCHARLYATRPTATHLTEFYLWVSVGGVIGGAFNGLLAPSIFNTLAEYPIALVLVGALKLPFRPTDRFTPRDLIYGAVALGVTLLLVWVARGGLPILTRGEIYGTQRTLTIFLVPALLCFLASDRPVRFALAYGAMFLGSQWGGSNLAGQLLTIQRSFFGVHKVVTSKSGRFHKLVHGNTLHGQQDTTRPEVPLTYYYPNGPIGQILDGLRSEPMMRDIALVGLGVGSLSAYSRPGDTYTFYEIDPKVKEISSNPRFFTFLQNAKGQLKFEMGDARLNLARAKDGSYGLIVLDAFSSDAIPVHLLTREAMAMYARKLKPGGILAYHISNRYLDLEPVVAKNAADLGMVGWSQQDSATAEEDAAGKTASNWVMVSANPNALKGLGQKVGWWSEISPDPRISGWTDDFSNVLSVFRTDM